MAKQEPFIKRFGGKAKKEKASGLTKKIQDEQAYLDEERRKQAEISKLLTDVRITLKAKEKKYQEMFEDQLQTARKNAKSGFKDGNNYARIGIAYYSKQVINAAQYRLKDMTSDFEIRSSLDELASALRMINELPKVVGTVDTKGVNKAARKMDKLGGTAGGDLKEALQKLSEMKFDETDHELTGDFVSRNEIERWINDEDYADECFENGSREQKLSGSELLDISSEVYRDKDVEEDYADLSLDELRMKLDSL